MTFTEKEALDYCYRHELLNERGMKKFIRILLDEKDKELLK